MKLIIQGKTNWKFLGIVVILAVIVGGGILYYWNSARKEILSALQQIPQIQSNTKYETAGWQTYRNEEYGFEIKYPESFKNTFSHDEMYFDHDESIFDPNYEENPFLENGGLQLAKIENNFEDWIDFTKRQYDHIYSVEPEKDYKYGFEITEFQSLKSVQFYSKNGYGEDEKGVSGFGFTGPEVLKIIYFEKDGYIWRLMLPDTPVFNQILSTFRFVPSR